MLQLRRRYAKIFIPGGDSTFYSVGRTSLRGMRGFRFVGSTPSSKTQLILPSSACTRQGTPEEGPGPSITISYHCEISPVEGSGVTKEGKGRIHRDLFFFRSSSREIICSSRVGRSGIIPRDLQDINSRFETEINTLLV